MKQDEIKKKDQAIIELATLLDRAMGGCITKSLKEEGENNSNSSQDEEEESEQDEKSLS